MSWKLKRKEIDDALKAEVMPLLRENGFKGSYPHFRRVNEDSIDIWGFQFSQYAPQFYIEIATCPKEGVTFLDGTHFPPKTIKYYQCLERVRIGQNPFDFESHSAKDIAKKSISECSRG